MISSVNIQSQESIDLKKKEEGEKKFLIRFLEEQDLQELKILDDMLFEVHYSDEATQEMIQYQYCGIGLFDVTTSTQKLIGVSTASREWRNIYSAQKDGYLATFGIHPDYRKMKLGTYLLRVTCQVLKKFFGCNVLTLHMLKSNITALSFYKKNNFLLVQFLKNYYHFDNQAHDGLLLIKYLDSFQYSAVPSNITIDPKVQSYMEKTERRSCCDRYFSEP